MAVAGVIRTKKYFHKQDTETPKLPEPRKRLRVSPTPEPSLPQTPMEEEGNCMAAPDPPIWTPSPPPSNGPVATAAAVQTALSTPWAGSTDFQYNDDDTFEDSNDVDYEGVQLEPTIDETLELESSDSDSDVGNSDFESNTSDTDEEPDPFETNADMNAAEHSK